MKPNATTETIAYVTLEDKDCAFFYARVTFKLYDENQDSIRNISESPLSDLTARMAISKEEKHYYHMETRYEDCYAVDLRTAERMAKCLTGLYRKLEKLSAKLGHTEDYPEYVARVLSVFGVTRVIFAADLPNVSWYSDIDGQVGRHFHTVSGARMKLAAWVKERITPAVKDTEQAA